MLRCSIKLPYLQVNNSFSLAINVFESLQLSFSSLACHLQRMKFRARIIDANIGARAEANSVQLLTAPI